MERLAAAQSASYGREAAIVLADHDRDLPDALRIARADVARRPDVYGHDVLAWTLHKNGRHAYAKRAAARALRLGTEEAVFHYHAGMIALALGHSRAAARHLARALAINPTFDVRHASMARATLETLEGERLALARRGGAR
jgi:tetratricopeptide (TPR) repeat protein